MTKNRGYKSSAASEARAINADNFPGTTVGQRTEYEQAEQLAVLVSIIGNLDNIPSS